MFDININNNNIEHGLIANPIGIEVEFLGVFNTPYVIYNKVMLRELDDFHHHFIVLNCEFEMEKSGLSNEYDINIIVKLLIFV